MAGPGGWTKPKIIVDVAEAIRNFLPKNIPLEPGHLKEAIREARRARTPFPSVHQNKVPQLSSDLSLQRMLEYYDDPRTAGYGASRAPPGGLSQMQPPAVVVPNENAQVMDELITIGRTLDAPSQAPVEVRYLDEFRSRLEGVGQPGWYWRNYEKGSKPGPWSAPYPDEQSALRSGHADWFGWD